MELIRRLRYIAKMYRTCNKKKERPTFACDRLLEEAADEIERLRIDNQRNGDE